MLHLGDPETGESLYLNSSNPTIRKAYEARVKKVQQDLEKELKSLKAEHILIRNKDSQVRALRNFFEARKRERRLRA